MLKVVVREGPSKRHRTYWGIYPVRRPFKGPMILVWIEGDPELWRYDISVTKAIETLKRYYKDDFGFEPTKIQVFHQQE